MLCCNDYKSILYCLGNFRENSYQVMVSSENVSVECRLIWPDLFPCKNLLILSYISLSLEFVGIHNFSYFFAPSLFVIMIYI